ncbi:MAG: hypothetical protein WB988_13475 [Candidatus Nitrosopolaris sp.]
MNDLNRYGDKQLITGITNLLQTLIAEWSSNYIMAAKSKDFSRNMWHKNPPSKPRV